ncbi:hypothetical protein C5167_011356 [Papaver somniferum]|uniref:Uncharacterized protein n=1 Tax=Papaver somniferum TaxID=3469 RepID=A0A4Y7K6P9_PAPSO|nr:hypothetical protein C5167_011356 [Papaver somniferum]
MEQDHLLKRCIFSPSARTGKPGPQRVHTIIQGRKL